MVVNYIKYYKKQNVSMLFYVVYRCKFVAKSVLCIVNTIILIIGIALIALGVVGIVYSGKLGDGLLPIVLMYSVLGVGGLILLISIIGYIAMCRTDKIGNCTSCCGYIYGFLLFIMIIAELLFTLSFLSLVDKVKLNISPFSDIREVFDIGINTTYDLCCLNTTELVDKCTFLGNDPKCDTIDEFKDFVLTKLDPYVMPIFYVFLGIMIAELFSLISGCCLASMKKYQDMHHYDYGEPLLKTAP